MQPKKQAVRTSLLSTLLLFLLAAHSLFAETDRVSVSYGFYETLRTEADQRKRLTHIYLSADGDVGFSQREIVYGATTPVVRSVTFDNVNFRKATKEEKAELVRELLAANVLDLTEGKSESKEYTSNLDIRIGDRKNRVRLYVRPDSPRIKAIHEVMFRFAKQMKMDQPRDEKKATTVTEGDTQPARNVTIEELLRNPDQYDGKRVSVVGFYRLLFESSDLAADRKASKNQDYERSLWRDNLSPFADKSAIDDRDEAWLRVDGIFLRGPGGHAGLWPGTIERITRLEPVPEPK